MLICCGLARLSRFGRNRGPGFLLNQENREALFELTAKQKKIQRLATAREAAAAARQASFQRLHRHATLGTTEHGVMKQCVQGQRLLTT